MLVPNPASSGFESRLDDPALFLNPHTENELRYLRFADKVTVDLHKSGYTPFPAGALCYRDGLLRFLVTWKSPVTGSVEADAMEMGIYGLEGSKPGAAPLAAWLGHEVIGLHKGGYGFLLGQSVPTSTRMYGHWATMSLDHPNLVLVERNGPRRIGESGGRGASFHMGHPPQAPSRIARQGSQSMHPHASDGLRSRGQFIRLQFPR